MVVNGKIDWCVPPEPISGISSVWALNAFIFCNMLCFRVFNMNIAVSIYFPTTINGILGLWASLMLSTSICVVRLSGAVWQEGGVGLQQATVSYTVLWLALSQGGG